MCARRKPEPACGVDQGVGGAASTHLALRCVVLLFGQRHCAWPMKSLGAGALSHGVQDGRGQPAP
eukprot:1241267-Pyramimonas_sp.AAC.1